MLPCSYTPWILHEQDGGHSHAIAKTPGRGLASRFVSLRGILPRVYPTPPIAPFAFGWPNHLILSRAQFPPPSSTPFNPDLSQAHPHSIPIGRGAALAAYWKSPYRQCSGPPASHRQLPTRRPEHCRYSPNDFPRAIRWICPSARRLVVTVTLFCLKIASSSSSGQTGGFRRCFQRYEGRLHKVGRFA
jgi:hypothetical protein